MSSDGRCKSFEASGDGYGRAEGIATLAFCRQSLDQALQHGAAAVVKSSGINQGGRSSGLTAPNGHAQAALVRGVLSSGSLSASQVGLLSVHGTGTALGDPIEMGALSQALAEATSSNQDFNTVALVSNKSCYGHTEGTAGITGLLLSIAVTHEQKTPGIMHLRNVNPYVAAAMRDWSRICQGTGAGACAMRQTAPAACTTRSDIDADLLMGTSSFGMSGINAHALISKAGSATVCAHEVWVPSVH